MGDPRTPPLKQKFSRRHWDSMVRSWRMQLHEWDPPTLDSLDLLVFFRNSNSFLFLQDCMAIIKTLYNVFWTNFVGLYNINFVSAGTLMEVQRWPCLKHQLKLWVKMAVQTRDYLQTLKKLSWKKLISSLPKG